ncbi:MAG: DUF885 domain-containing protein [Bacteroidota bacterium]
MKTPLLIFAILSVFSLDNCPKEPTTNLAFQSFVNSFGEGYSQLEIPSLQLSYVANFEAIQEKEALDRQEVFFNDVQEQYASFKTSNIPTAQYTDFLLIGHEITLNLERISLEKAFLDNYPDRQIPDNGIYNIKDGKAWYQYYLKKWLGAEVMPEALFDFGLYEVHVVADAIANIRQQTGMDEEAFFKHLDSPEFFVDDPSKVQEVYEQKREIVNQKLDLLFHNPGVVPEVNIAKGDNAALSQVPGYYSPLSGTFYYNLFDKPYNNRQYDLLFLHEGNPGHHFQSNIASMLELAEYRQHFSYYGYLEGWAAYVEELGALVGLYKTNWDHLGKWEWDQVRSIRVALDVGINYQGWTDDAALAFWQAYVPNQEDIAMREIKRMRNWPAQVHTYKYGAAKIIRLKSLYKDKKGAEFDIRDFHHAILSKGPLPLEVLENVIKRELEII